MSTISDRMYDENERLVTLKQLEAFSLNPFALWGLIESYIQHVHPKPIRYLYEHHLKDKMMDHKEGDQSAVQLDIRAVGNVQTKYWGTPTKLDQEFLKMFCRSYYEYSRPLPVSFQVLDAIEVHLRTPGVSDDDYKNPLRDHWLLREEGPKKSTIIV